MLTVAAADGDALSSRPAWLTELSLTTRESWESNVYLTNKAGPGGRDLANRPSYVTGIAPKLALDLAPLLKGSDPDFDLKHLNLAYTPEIIRFHDQPGENHDIHRVATGLEASWASFSIKADNLLSLVDGSHETPQYTGRSSIAIGLIRERRDQIQDRMNLQLRYDGGGWFLRPAASFVYYDLQTDLRVATGANAGWQNYADRYDLNGGVDAGFEVLPGFFLISGYRHGRQHQGNLFAASSNSSNDYDRLLFGWEGKPLPWLKTQFQAGPDFRSYGKEVPAGHETDKNFFYLDGSLTADCGSGDSITLKARQSEGVSGSGINSYQETSFGVVHKHKWNASVETGTELKWLRADYDDPSSMNDTLYTLHEDLAWKINKHFTLSADYSFSQSQDMTENANASLREYANHQVGISLKASY